MGWLGNLFAWLLPKPKPAPVVVVRPLPQPVPVSQRAIRAARALHGPRGYYGLGCGGTDPSAPLPWGPYRGQVGEDPARLAVRRAAGSVWCDCSGGVAWVLGIPREIPGYAQGYGWFSTDGIIADARDPKVEIVEIVPIGSDIVPWRDLVVYGWQDKDHDGARDPGEIGHVGVICGVPDGWRYLAPLSLGDLDVWHCAASKNEGPSGAIRISKGGPWALRGIVVRVIG